MFVVGTQGRRYRVRFRPRAGTAAAALALAALCFGAWPASDADRRAPVALAWAASTVPDVRAQAGLPGAAEVREAGVRRVRVRPGDTLWDIAVRYMPHTDPRRAVNALMAANGLASPLLRPGTVLLVPGDGR